MKISPILLISLLSILLPKHLLYAAKFTNKTERSIILYTLDEKVVIDTLMPASDKVIDIESCIAHIRGDKEYTFKTIKQQESIIFAEISSGIIITRIETKE